MINQKNQAVNQKNRVTNHFHSKFEFQIIKLIKTRLIN
jgi:hypothetical protein